MTFISCLGQTLHVEPLSSKIFDNISRRKNIGALALEPVGPSSTPAADGGKQSSSRSLHCTGITGIHDKGTVYRHARFPVGVRGWDRPWFFGSGRRWQVVAREDDERVGTKRKGRFGGGTEKRKGSVWAVMVNDGGRR
jgi:hypothetical protein